MKILFCGETFPKAYELLKTLMPEDDVFNCPAMDVVKVGADVDALVPLMHHLAPELIENTRAGLIQQFGVGLEGVDVNLASRNGIMVCNIPSYLTPNAESTAEHAVFLMMAVARKIHQCFAAFHVGPWGEPIGQALIGETALVVGLGNVGKALARKLSALGMSVMAVRRTENPQFEKEAKIVRAENMSCLHELAAQADFVIACVSLNDQTRGLFDDKLFSVMKPSAYVINISRGAVVNETALLSALKDSRIAGAGLDVFEQEPLTERSPLLSMPNVVATPHVAGATRQNYYAIGSAVQKNMTLYKNGQTPENCVNLQQLAYSKKR